MKRARVAENELSLMTFNVLAREYTSHNQDAHCNCAILEDPSQTKRRYKLASKQILDSDNDLVFLQECSPQFFETDMNEFADQLLEAYELFICQRQNAPGTAILVNKHGRASPLRETHLCVGGGHEFGGISKIATLVTIRVGDREFTAVSTHFAYDANKAKRLHHAQMMGASLGEDGRVILGGDFNCQPGSLLDELVSSSFLAKLQRVSAHADAPTGDCFFLHSCKNACVKGGGGQDPCK